MKKKLLLIITISLFLVSCGKDNVTGTGAINPVGTGLNTTVSGYGIQTLNQNQAQTLNVVLNESQCINGGQRLQITIPIQGNSSAGQIFVGATPEGDVAVIHNDNGQPTLTAYLCQRPDMGAQGQLAQQIVTNTSQYCNVDEITAATMYIPSTYGYQPYELRFRPIHFDNSSLCQ